MRSPVPNRTGVTCVTNLSCICTEGNSCTEALNGEIDQLRMAHEALRSEVWRILNNAESWHGDDAAKGRALAVIALWAKEALDA